MDDCFKRQAATLGPQHPDTLSAHEALTAWRLEALEIQEQEEP